MNSSLFWFIYSLANCCGHSKSSGHVFDAERTGLLSTLLEHHVVVFSSTFDHLRVDYVSHFLIVYFGSYLIFDLINYESYNN